MGGKTRPNDSEHLRRKSQKSRPFTRAGTLATLPHPTLFSPFSKKNKEWW